MIHSVGGLLLVSVAGYWVLERASAHKGGLKRVGQWLGAVIILVSLIGVACKVWYLATCPSGSTGKGGYCPFPMKAPRPPSPSQ